MSSGDFKNRIKAAANRFDQKTKTEEDARKERDQKRKDFLQEFWGKGHEVIEPVLTSAQEDLEHSNISWSDNEDRIVLTFAPGAKYAVLVFLADAMTMRVRLHTAIGSVASSKDIERFQDIQEGAGRIVPAAGDFTLAQLDKQTVEDCVATFVEKAFGA